MARPTKSAKLLTPCSQTKAEIAARVEIEDQLRGAARKLKPSKYLTTRQKRIFNHIVGAMSDAEVLGNLDVYLLEQASICIDRLQEIEATINNRTEAIFDRDVIYARNAYAKDFQRYCNELSLSPQSRAKIANLTMRANQKKEDPLLAILKNGGGKLA